jgi:hypothetical protein
MAGAAAEFYGGGVGGGHGFYYGLNQLSAISFQLSAWPRSGLGDFFPRSQKRDLGHPPQLSVDSCQLSVFRGGDAGLLSHPVSLLGMHP